MESGRGSTGRGHYGPVGVGFVGNGAHACRLSAQNNGRVGCRGVHFRGKSNGIDDTRAGTFMDGADPASVSAISWRGAICGIGVHDLDFTNGLLADVRGLVFGVRLVRTTFHDVRLFEPKLIRLGAVGNMDNLGGYHQTQWSACCRHVFGAICRCVFVARKKTLRMVLYPPVVAVGCDRRFGLTYFMVSLWSVVEAI